MGDTNEATVVEERAGTADGRAGAPVRTHEVIIVGSGFSGQSAVIRLEAAGITDYVILERRSFMGGTWCQNSYPGAAVDVHSPLYSISSEPYPWTQMFAEQDELREYTEHVIDKHRMRDKTELDADVCDLSWDDHEHVWTVTTRDGRRFRGRFVILGSGPLSTPKIPDFPGRDTFEGHTFHSNGWDHDYDLAGKKVAVVGSGASAAQIIPAIAPEVGELHVFQRTPHWVMPRPDRRFSALERKVLANRYAYAALRGLIYLSLETRVIGFKYSRRGLEKVAQAAALRHIEDQIADPELRRKVTPDYTIGCKRVVLSSTLYPALCRDNVTLHDAADGIDEITPRGILTKEGTKVELDLIVYATGYDAVDGVTTYTVHGRNGTPLTAAWAEYPRAYLGTAMPAFPNLFVMLGPNTGIGHTSALFIMESQLMYVMGCIQEVRRRGARSVEPTAAAERRYTDHIHDEMQRTVWMDGGCNSWYRNDASGKVIAMYPGFSFTYRWNARRFRAADHRFD